MFQEHELRGLADWQVLDGFSEASAGKAVGVFASAVESRGPFKADIRGNSYNSYEGVYVYRPELVVREAGVLDGRPYVRHRFPSLVFYFSLFAPVVAFGRTEWDKQIYDDGGPYGCWGFGGLDLPQCLKLEDLEPGPFRSAIEHAIGLSGYRCLTPQELHQPMPSWFEPLQRSEGLEPWDRLFHLLFQFND
ncbi:hypothetical protein HNQ51_000508 [Inhella inkyongensis]|uniref:Uncharacterized protein n=1 Tax=Inhella inkyongensis TaxID=392593 RepID=A0A840RZ12_9BURK|nr:hypothetical protein [Inhella inkyongensis]MBB5203215.1 hypothetical protein [Inhella inkyongensis]